ncbi:MAG: DUF2520 domain-containing protein [Bifidobacteriaceae bacterium]|jgi:predicted short-subunit dehydrogenase-like oxidoreductase (DUF2520 family)|nr:DUF2520 domain-containing protein [Bifidobacteriaceae bacterium]
MDLDALPFGVIGFGRVGAAIAGALHGLGHPNAGVTARSDAGREHADAVLPGVAIRSPEEVADRAGLVFLTVPDSQILPLAQQLAGHWRAGQILVHTSGAQGLAALEPAAAAGALTLAIHPAMTFTGTSLDVGRMRGAHFGVEAPPGLAPLADALVMSLGGTPFRLPSEVRPIYHAALSHAANHLVTLIAQALDVLAWAGVDQPGEVLTPLVTEALGGALANGMGALTGPAARGDAATLGLHRTAWAEYAAAHGALVDPGVVLDQAAAVALDAVNSYRALARATIRQAAARGMITAEQAASGEAQVGGE